MKIIVTGYLGMLGSEIYTLLKKKYKIIGLDKDKVDLEDFPAAAKLINAFSPDIIIHTAAMTNVDQCEDAPAEAELQNYKVTENIAKLSNRKKIKLIYISTDYIFDGEKKGFYLEDDITHPISVYGWTKLRGEKAVLKYKRNLSIRIAWLFGKNRKNFVNFVIDNLKQGKNLKIINDQFGTPTYAPDLSLAIEFLIEKNAAGIFNAANDGECSWYDWARFIKSNSGLSGSLTPISSTEFKRSAPRPKNSKLENFRLKEEYSYNLPHWQDATLRFLKGLGY